MKNKSRHSLDRELKNVRVSGELKRRILAEAGASRAPERSSRRTVLPLAAAAAVVLVIGLTAGVTMLRAEKQDLSATPLNAATMKPKQPVVYVSDDDGLYHWQTACGEMTDMRSMKPEEARAEGRKACSECLGGEASGAEELVWMTPSGKYYHAAHDCSGMSGAIGLLQIEARTRGRWACPMCMDGEVMPEEALAPYPLPTEMPTRGPMGEQEEHPDEMFTLSPLPTAMPTQHPAATPEPEAYVMPTAAATVEPTPMTEGFDGTSAAVVMNEAEDVSFWMTKNGVYYHIDEHCSGMEGAHVCTEEEAVKAGKILCMVCMPEKMASDASDVGGFDGPSANFDTEDRSVWTTEAGAYYHAEADCSGMEDAYGCEVLEALANGKAPCPKCAKQLAEVWATENGRYYHLTADCSGMTGAREISGNDAVMQGKTLCPVCRNEIAEAAVAETE